MRRFACLSVCLLAGLHKPHQMDLPEIFSKDGPLHISAVINFW